MTFRTFRALPHDTFGSASVTSKDGHVHTIAANSTADIPSYAAELLRQGVVFALSGTTAQRPAPGDSDLPGGVLKAGTVFVDTTLNKVIMYTGASWRDVLTGGAV